jgi:hypothetical protein
MPCTAAPPAKAGLSPHLAPVSRQSHNGLYRKYIVDCAHALLRHQPLLGWAVSAWQKRLSHERTHHCRLQHL